MKYGFISLFVFSWDFINGGLGPNVIGNSLNKDMQKHGPVNIFGFRCRLLMIFQLACPE